MEKIEVTKTEKRIIEMTRNLKMYENLKIIADQNGKPDTYFIERVQKGFLGRGEGDLKP